MLFVTAALVLDVANPFPEEYHRFPQLEAIAQVESSCISYLSPQIQILYFRVFRCSCEIQGIPKFREFAWEVFGWNPRAMQHI